MKWRKFPKRPEGSASNQYLCMREQKKRKHAQVLVCQYEDYSEYGDPHTMMGCENELYEMNYFDYWIPVEEVIADISFGKLK